VPFSDDQFNRDLGYCRLMGRTTQASGYAFRGVWFSTAGASGVNADVMNDCMRVRGYHVTK
jgi:hypothetical protein